MLLSKIMILRKRLELHKLQISPSYNSFLDHCALPLSLIAINKKAFCLTRGNQEQIIALSYWEM